MGDGKKGKYWDSMIINGLATSSILNSEPKIITNLIEKGAIGASVSGNGPSIAAIVKKKRIKYQKSIHNIRRKNYCFKNK